MLKSGENCMKRINFAQLTPANASRLMNLIKYLQENAKMHQISCELG